MNRYTAVSVIAIIAIVAPFLYSGISVLGAHELEYRWAQQGKFSFFELSNHGDVEFCNPLPFWIGFDGFDVDVYYESRHQGTFAVGQASMGPLAYAVNEGTFSSEEIVVAQHVFMTMDFQFDGGEIRLDPNKFVIVASVHTPILGLIPYSTSMQISGPEFDQMMNAERLSC